MAARDGLRIHRIGGQGDIVDERGLARDAYGFVPGDWVLVRPDGYIGARGPGATGLDAYLAMVMPPAPRGRLRC